MHLRLIKSYKIKIRNLINLIITKTYQILKYDYKLKLEFLKIFIIVAIVRCGTHACHVPVMACARANNGTWQPLRLVQELRKTNINPSELPQPIESNINAIDLPRSSRMGKNLDGVCCISASQCWSMQSLSMQSVQK